MNVCIVHTVYENALLFSVEYYGASQSPAKYKYETPRGSSLGHLCGPARGASNSLASACTGTAWHSLA